MQAGFAKIDITPDVPVTTLYTRTPEAIATRIAGRLFARVSIFQTDKSQAVLISADLLGLDSWFTRKVKDRLQAQGVRPDNVVVACTHSHTTPNTLNFNGADDLLKKETAYLGLLESRILEAVDAALEDLEPAEIISASTRVDLSVNRREKGRMAVINDLDAETGLVDQELGVIVVRQNKSKKTSVLLNYAAHPLSMGKESTGAISADYPGELCRLLEEGDYKFAQFFQGAAGNINVKVSGGLQVSRKVGHLLADAVGSIALPEKADQSQDLEIKAKDIHVPVDSLGELLKQPKAPGTPDASEAEWRKKAKAVDKSAKSVPLLIQYLRIGNTCLAVLPGEQFVETGLSIKEQLPSQHCFVVSYANCGEVGYVPAEKAFAEGDYEVDVAYKCYGDFLYRVSQEAAACFVSEMVLLSKQTV